MRILDPEVVDQVMAAESPESLLQTMIDRERQLVAQAH
jgi:hypothetical protein